MRQIDHHTRDYSLYASWVADLSSSSVPMIPNIKPKDHKKQQVYIYIRMSEKSETKRVMSK